MKRFGLPLIIVAVLGAMIAIFVIGNNNDHASTASVTLLGDKHPN